jgi:hypothetical protein
MVFANGTIGSVAGSRAESLELESLRRKHGWLRAKTKGERRRTSPAVPLHGSTSFTAGAVAVADSESSFWQLALIFFTANPFTAAR